MNKANHSPQESNSLDEQQLLEEAKEHSSEEVVASAEAIEHNPQAAQEVDEAMGQLSSEDEALIVEVGEAVNAGKDVDSILSTPNKVAHFMRILTMVMVLFTGVSFTPDITNEAGQAQAFPSGKRGKKKGKKGRRGGRRGRKIYYRFSNAAVRANGQSIDQNTKALKASAEEIKKLKEKNESFTTMINELREKIKSMEKNTGGSSTLDWAAWGTNELAQWLFILFLWGRARRNKGVRDAFDNLK